MTERDLVRKRLRELYDFNRGALYANSLIQAQAAFEQGDFASTLELVRASRQLFERRHKKTLSPDAAGPDAKRKLSRQERRVLESRQARMREILGIFDEVLGPLEKMAKFQRLGSPRPAQKAPAGAAPPSESVTSDWDSAADSSAAITGRQKSYTECLIDMGSFTQLLTAAQQSEIVPNADQIAQIRDCEFRLRKYQAAFDAIERLLVKFSLTAAQREQKLRREEIDYKSGVLKMSPKQWQLKKQRDTLQTQKIERARRHFARVLDGLRVLLSKGTGAYTG